MTQNIKAQVARVEVLKAGAKHFLALQEPWLNNGVNNSRNGLSPVLHDSPRAADDDRRERLNMKRYGIWEITLVTVSGKVDICEITARSGKDARSRVEAGYEGCQILKMTRKTWLNRFSYSEMADALMVCAPAYADSLLTILEDNGIFSGQGAD